MELAILQERALWDLLSLFFLEGGGGGDGGGEAGSGGASVQHGTQAQVRSLGWRGAGGEDGVGMCIRLFNMRCLALTL